MTIGEVYERIKYLLSITNTTISDPAVNNQSGFSPVDYLFFKDIDLDLDIIPDAIYKLQSYKHELSLKNLWTDDLERATKPKFPSFKKRVPRPASGCQVIQTGTNVEISQITGYAWDLIYTLKSIGAKPKENSEGYSWIVDLNKINENKERLTKLGIDFSNFTIFTKKIVPEVKRSGQVTIKKARKKLHFTCTYNPELIQFFRNHHEFTYNNKNHSNAIELNKENSELVNLLIEKIRALGFFISGEENISDLDQKLKEFRLEQAQLSEVREKGETVKNDFEVDIPGLEQLKLIPFGFQKAGIAFLNMAKGRAILGDEMGLGKTFQAIAWVVLNKKKALVICQKSMLFGWKEEIEKVSYASAQVLTSKTNLKKEPLNGSDFTIVNYESADKFKFENYDTIIIDESHLIKNKKTDKYKTIKKLAEKAAHILCLSGTAIVSRPEELYTQLHLVKPSLAGSYQSYTSKFCGAFHDGYRWNMKGASNLSELVSLIAPVYIRRNKKDVLKDLPEKIRQEIVIQGIKIEDPMDGTYEGMFSWLTKAKVRLANEKVVATIEFAKNMVEQGNKVIIFSEYVDPILQISKAFGSEAVCYVASLSPEERASARTSFQNDPSKKVFAATLKLASTALTLTAASRVIFNDLPWTPGGLLQAEDRAHRIGQKEMVNVYRMVARGKLDDYVTKLLTEKAEILKTVLEGRLNDFTPEEAAKAEKTILTDIIDYFRVNNFKNN